MGRGLPVLRRAPAAHVFVDLGMSPLCESYLRADQLNEMEPFYPLHVYVCDACFLVQLEEYVPPEEIFTEYAYFSSYADCWVEHARALHGRDDATASASAATASSSRSRATTATCCSTSSRAASRASASSRRRTSPRRAEERGVPTLVEFFGASGRGSSWRRGRQADLLLGNNVLAQVPDLNDFVAGMKILLAPDGVVTMEFPHLLRLMRGEPVRHDLPRALLATSRSSPPERIFAAHGLTLFDVEEMPTHGGSLRIYACHDDDATKPVDRAGSASCAAREERRPARTRRATATSASRCARPSASSSSS